MDQTRQPQCRICDSTELDPYGWKWQNATGWLRVWKCKTCDPLSRVFIPLDPGYQAKSLVLSAREMLIKAVAIYAHGFPLKVVEEFTQVKSETVSLFLKKVHRLDLWGELEGRILGMKRKRKLPGVKPDVVSKVQLDWLHELIKDEVILPGSLRFFGRVKAVEYRKRRKRNQQKIGRILHAILADPKVAQRNSEIMRQAY